MINIIDEMKKKRKVIKLQEKYENGIIAEKNIGDNEKEEIIKLYKEQIKTLEDNINIYKKNLLSYKTKIIELKNKTES